MTARIDVVRARVGLPLLDDRFGGFSAGGLAAVNAAYGMGAPVKAVISLSGGMSGFDLRKTVEAGTPPGFGHFYPKGATSLGSDMTRLTLEGRVLRFLDKHLGVQR